MPLLSEQKLSIGVDIEDCGRIMNAIAESYLVEGAIAEVGVAEGGSAAIIATINQVINKKPIYLFDTFAGLPVVGKYDVESAFSKGQYFADYKRVKEFFKRYKEVKIYKGIFPKSGKWVAEKMFSFVHLDVDLYKSTYESLDFFWPRITPGGTLISHDYQTEKGVKQAFDDYFRGTIPIETPGRSQCFVRKI